MMRLVYTGLLFISFSALAQESIQAESDNGKPYILHTVLAGETLSGLSRSYKIPVAEIAAFNKLSTDKGLQKDQALRIPLHPSNLSQSECRNCAKVYYKVQPKEGLYRIGLNFGNVKAETLKNLNNLPGESVDIGKNLLMGYLVASASAITKAAAPAITEKEQPATEPPVIKTAPVVTDKKPPVTVVKNNMPPVAAYQPPVITAPVHTDGSGTGLFAGNYAGKMGISKTGTAAVFKSTSGWDDTKYYVLMNDANPGTIVKVFSTATGKTIYAKVLGELPQIKQNENVLLRISNAAAVALGSSEENLNIAINY